MDGSDLAIFAADFGRTDCVEDCKGDFDNDSDVDGRGLAVFAADFGRTECPSASGIIDSYAKEIQRLRSELKAKEISELKAR